MTRFQIFAIISSALGSPVFCLLFEENLRISRKLESNTRI